MANGSWRIALVAFVVLVAVVFRLPKLQQVPHLTDETTEVLWAYDIAFRSQRPLTHTDAYDGPLWPYGLALAMRVFGASAELPRRLALALGLASLAATAGLAGLLAPPGRRFVCGCLASLIQAVTFSHAVVASRVAWSNNGTPLWSTLFLITLILACRQGRILWYVTAGLLAGLALQSHPSAIAPLTASVLWFLAAPTRRATLRSAGPWLAVTAAAAAYSPVLFYNLRNGLGSFHEAAASSNLALAADARTWAVSIGAAWLQLGRSLSGAYGLDGPSAALTPLAVAYSLLASAVVFGLGMRQGSVGSRLPATVFAGSLAILPLVNSNWHGLLESRYLGFLWPLVAASGAVLATSGGPFERPGDAAPEQSQGPAGPRDESEAVAARPERAGQEAPSGSRRSVAWPLAGLVAVVMVVPALRIAQFDAAARQEHFTNERLWHMLRAVEEAADGQPLVLVDRDLKAVHWRAGGQPRRAVEYLLTLEGIPFVRAPLPKMNHLLEEGGAYYLFLSDPNAEYLRRRYALRPIDVATRPDEEPWGLYVTPSVSPEDQP